MASYSIARLLCGACLLAATGAVAADGGGSPLAAVAPPPPALPAGVGGISFLGCFAGNASFSRAAVGAPLLLPRSAPRALAPAFSAFSACSTLSGASYWMHPFPEVQPSAVQLVGAATVRDCAAHFGASGKCYTAAGSDDWTAYLFPAQSPLALCHAVGPLLLSLVRSGNATMCWAAQLEVAQMDTAHPPAFGAPYGGIVADGSSCAPAGGDAASCPALDAADAAAAATRGEAALVGLYLMWHHAPPATAIQVHTAALMLPIVPFMPVIALVATVQVAVTVIAFVFSGPAIYTPYLVVLLLYMRCFANTTAC